MILPFPSLRGALRRSNLTGAMGLPRPDKSGLAMIRGEGLRMTLVDVIKQPRIICVDFFHATANFENKIDKANS